MPIQVEGSGHHFNAYYEDNSLLLQLIISEFIKTYRLTFQIKILIYESMNSMQPVEATFSSLFQTLSELIGCLLKPNVSFSILTEGSLTKLKEYSEQFSYNSKHENQHHVHLHMVIHQTWLTAIQNLELLNLLYVSNKQTHRIAALLPPIRQAFGVLQRHFNQVIYYIPQILSAFWDNEHVILYMLRKRAPLTEIYGSNFLYQCFKKPIKPDELSQLLIQRYQSKGFNHLIPKIQQLFSSEQM